MKKYYFAVSCIIATWILLLIGGIVNPMGASLACPDWVFLPTCHGEVFPVMQGGVLYEHGHRLWASLVGIMTVALACACFISETDKTTRALCMLAVFLVALQGTLGGVTVLLGLNAWISTLHLMTAMGFLCLLIYIAFRLSPFQSTLPTVSHQSKLVVISLFLILAQIVLGGIVRHVGAGLACGDDWISCGPQFWPTWNLGKLHMLHRLLGYTVTVVTAFACYQGYKSAVACKRTFAKRFAFIPLMLIAVQVGLGLATVATIRDVTLVVLHTAVGALVLASMFILHLSLGKQAVLKSDVLEVKRQPVNTF